MPLKGCLQTFCKLTNYLMIHQKGMRLNHDFYVVVGKPIQYLYTIFFYNFQDK